MSIDIANLPSGNYTLKLITTQSEVKKKFIIK
ncbi:MAG: T9SS type A sorting domain-containing protein [Bacteroidales bacterium]|nr:T9SS type A sorting domain-containing protein [Bacteroidales bacterium]